MQISQITDTGIWKIETSRKTAVSKSALDPLFSTEILHRMQHRYSNRHFIEDNDNVFLFCNHASQQAY